MRSRRWRGSWQQRERAQEEPPLIEETLLCVAHRALVDVPIQLALELARREPPAFAARVFRFYLRGAAGRRDFREGVAEAQEWGAARDGLHDGRQRAFR